MTPEFLLEDKKSRSINLDREKLLAELRSGSYSKTIKFIKSNKAKNSEAELPFDNLIYRGITTDKKFFYIEPSKFNRVSKGESNYYTFITDQLINWDRIPRRSLSVIGSTNRFTAFSYGRLYVVIPKDNSPIGYGRKSDFWGNFPYLEDQLSVPSLPRFNEVLKHLFGAISNFLKDESLKLSDKKVETHEAFHDFVEKVDEKINDYCETHKIPIKRFFKKLPSANPHFKLYFEKNYDGSLWNCFSDLFDPLKNDISVTSIEKIPYRDQIEVWTDGDCVLIRGDLLDEIFNEL